MEHTIRDGCTHAYVGIALLLAIFTAPFVGAMHGQELPNAPQAAVKQQIPPVHKPGQLLARGSWLAQGRPLAHGPRLTQPGNLDPGSADWFRERVKILSWRGLFRLLTHIDWYLSFGKPKEAGYGNRKSR
jgi:hypothetical protein